MSVNLAQALREGARLLKDYSETAHLDAEILLAHVLQKDKIYLYAHSDEKLNDSQMQQYQSFIKRRQKHEPIAYIVGHKEFWSLDLCVTPDVLIPRPETELLVELALDAFPKEKKITVADLGLGSGAVAIAIATERPKWEIFGTENSKHALKIAMKNSERFNLKNVYFVLSDWFSALPKNKFNIILSNPPYISVKEDLPKDVKFEPRRALIAKKNGLAALEQIVAEAKDYLQKEGMLFVEHGATQEKEVANFFEREGYSTIKTFRDMAEKPRVTCGKM